MNLLKNKKGFSIIDLIISVSVIGALLMILAFLMTNYYNFNEQYDAKMQMINLANNKIKEIRSNELGDINEEDSTQIDSRFERTINIVESSYPDIEKITVTINDKKTNNSYSLMTLYSIEPLVEDINIYSPTLTEEWEPGDGQPLWAGGN